MHQALLPPDSSGSNATTMSCSPAQLYKVAEPWRSMNCKSTLTNPLRIYSVDLYTRTN